MLLQIIRKKTVDTAIVLRCGGMSSYLRPAAPQIGVNRKETAMDTLLLSRIQFAANISFHILFPTITIALGWVLFFFHVRFARTGDDKWMAAYRFWVKVFALSFAMGVVSGITMSFQFGTNWPGFMETVGNIAGPLLAYEVLTAFFLEAVFIGIMLFGFSPCAGLAAHAGNGAGGLRHDHVRLLDHRPELVDAHAAGLRDATVGLCHRLVGDHLQPVHALPPRSYAAGEFPDGGLPGCGRLGLPLADRRPLREHAGAEAPACPGCTPDPAADLHGDLHGLNTKEHQPAEGRRDGGPGETQRGAPLVLFAIPDEEARENRFEIGIPGGASLILKHDIDGVVPGLNDFVAEDGTVLHPPVAPLFFAFRIMVGIGFAMLFVAWIGSWMIWRRGDINRPLAYVLVPMALSGWVATLAGWYTTEIGRQPWLVSGVLKTADAVTTVPASSVGITLAAYLLVYAGLIAAYLSVIVALALKAAKAPQQPPSVKDPGIDPDPAMALGMGR
jgi:cytochrome d ubiquinol oxidase subunit I